MSPSLKFLKPRRRNPPPELTIPAHFRCPISLDLMKDPVTLATGITYDRQSIETWFDSGNRSCPVTKHPLPTVDLIPNHNIRRMIQDWCVDNRSFGIERIPTPRIPISPAQVSQLLSQISSGIRRKDLPRVREIAMKMGRLSKESDRDRRCLKDGGAAAPLSAAFDAFATMSAENPATGLEEILQVLTLMFPLDRESRSHLGSAASLRALEWLLRCGDLGGQRSAALVVKELVSADRRLAASVAAAPGFVERFAKVIREPICPQTTKAALVVVFHLIHSATGRSIAAAFAEMGMVAVLLEMIVDSEKSICEKALGVLDGILSSEKGREMGYSNALTMPVVVKKMFRVSNLATEFAISILSKLCRGCKVEEESGVLVEALRVGAFHKVLLLLQVGCSEKTKEKATELLKVLNMYRGRVECVDDSMDLKQLKRPF